MTNLKSKNMASLLKVCPSFRDKLEHDEAPDLLYVVLGRFARHLLSFHQQHDPEGFSAIGEMIEHLHTHGDEYVKEAATIGLLEGIQHVWRNNGVDPEQFFPFLLPESARWWKKLNAYWEQSP